MRINTGLLPLRGRSLSALRQFNHGAWVRCVTGALNTHPTVQLAANELGVSWRTLMRWRKELKADGQLPPKALVPRAR